MSVKPKSMRTLVVLLVAIGGCIPVILYGLYFAGVPTVTALEARRGLTASGSQAVLVDVRAAEQFEAGHLEGAENWPYESIMALSSAEDVPLRFRDKRLYLVCSGGISSARAGRRLRALSIKATHVRGGMQAWVATARKSDQPGFSRLQTSSGEIQSLPHRELSELEQRAAVIAPFVIKPLYMLFALLLVVVLLGSRSPDLTALRWGLVFFLVGETFCAVNTVYTFAHSEQSDVLEYLHGLGMAVCMGFVAFALLDGLDRRIVRYSDPGARCAVLGLCRACIKNADVPCGLERTFQLVTPMVAIVALMPLSARLHMVSYNTSVFGVSYNYSHPAVQQIFETRYSPLLAIVLLSMSFLALLVKSENRAALAKVFLAAGLGLLAFGLFRLIVLTMYRDAMVWFVFWEEMTELLFIIAVGLILWNFRRGLFKTARPHAQTT